METTIVMQSECWLQWLFWGLHWDNGKENGNYYSIVGYIGVYKGYIGVILGQCRIKWKIRFRV